MKRLKLLRAFTKFLRNNSYLGKPPRDISLGYVGEFIEQADKGKNIIDTRLFYIRTEKGEYFMKEKELMYTSSRLEAGVYTYEETQKYVSTDTTFEEINKRDHNTRILTYIKLISSHIITT